MTEKQRKAVTQLLKANKSNKNYDNIYLISHNEFLDPKDKFADFCCEHLEGKNKFAPLIKKLLSIDKSAKFFVKLYGLEESDDEPLIYSDTVIIFSELPLNEIEKIFNAPKDIFPSDIGIIDAISNQTYIVDNNGNLSHANESVTDKQFTYYCWWD